MSTKFTDEDIFDYGITRLADESQGAYNAFLTYSQLLPRERNTKEGREKIISETGYTESTLKQFAVHHRWEERATNIDARRWLNRERAIEQEQRADIAKWVGENKSIKSRVMKISSSLLEKCETYANDVISKDEYKMKPHEFAKIFEVAVKQARLVNELPTEITKTQILTAEQLKDLDAEQLQVLFEREMQDITHLEGIQNISEKPQ